MLFVKDDRSKLPVASVIDSLLTRVLKKPGAATRKGEGVGISSNLNKPMRWDSRSSRDPSGHKKNDTDAINGARIWALVVEPVVEAIHEGLSSNQLLPAFVVENPFHYFGEKIALALNEQLDNFRIEYKSNDSKLASFAESMLRAVDTSDDFRLLVLCTSRASVPAEFRSLIRTDGYLSIPAVSFDRLNGFSQREVGVELPESDRYVLDGLGPQELITASTLGASNWHKGLRQVAAQKQAANASGQQIRLDDLHGIDPARHWADQLISDIAHARAGKIAWDEVDRGALIAGPPGTGKTTIARAIANDCGIDFIPISPVRDWKSADGLSDALDSMSATFASARQRKPCILFIDEIDTLGNREQFTGQNASWDTAFLNNLLTEMDGFETDDQLFVIGATNYPDRVDGALKRAGRLDRTIHVQLPNTGALTRIYSHHLNKYNVDLGDDDLHRCAQASIGLSGADVESVVRDARRRARKDKARDISRDDILDAVFKIPPEAERQPIDEHELRNTAVHEAGHAILAYHFESTRNRLNFVSVIPSEDSLGFVSIAPQEHNATLETLLERICILMGGRAAEDVFLTEQSVSTGSGGRSKQSDIARARQLAEYAIGLCGFSTVTPCLWQEEPPLGEVTDIVSKQYETAKRILQENERRHRRLVNALVHSGRLVQHEVSGLIEN